MSAPDYDVVCNHCGKAIHPARGSAETEAELRRLTAEQRTQPQDCVYIQRSPGGFWIGHPKTNYVCLDCDRLLDEFLQATGVR